MAVTKHRLVGPNPQRTRYIVDTLPEVTLIDDMHLGDDCTIGDSVLMLLYTQLGWVPQGPALPELATRQTNTVVATSPTLVNIPLLAFTARPETTYHVIARLLYDMSSTSDGIALSVSCSGAILLLAGHWLMHNATEQQGTDFNASGITATTKSSPFLTRNYASLEATLVTLDEVVFSLLFGPDKPGATATIIPGSILRTCVIPA